MKKTILLIAIMCIMLTGCCSKPPPTNDSKLKRDLETEKANVRYWLAKAENCAEEKVANKLEYAQSYKALIAIKDAEFENAISALKEKFAKANLVKPTEQWLSLHGDSLASYHVYNTNLLLQQAGAAKKPNPTP